jgi:DNA polymerase I
MPTQLFSPGADDVVHVVDLSGYVFRAYHAIAPLSSPGGEPTHAVFGTVNMLERMIRQRRPKLLGVAMDSRTPTFRKQQYPEYKANRPAPPDDLKQQMRRVADVIEAFPLPCLQADGYEADDIIATLVRVAREQSKKVVIVSADKDLMQLVGPDVVLWDTMREKVIGVEEVEERFGVRVDQVRDVLALTGDTSDNIPGVPSVGPKTATTLLQEFGTLEGIYQNLDKIPRKKLRETLEEHRDKAFLSQKLVTLDAHVPLPIDPSALHYTGRNLDKLRELYGELGFTRQLAALNSEAAAAPSGSAPPPAGSAPPPAPVQGSLFGASAAPSPEPTPDLITSGEQLAAIGQAIVKARRLAIYPLTVGSGAMHQHLVGLGLSWGSSERAYVPLGHRVLGAPKAFPLGQLAELFQSLDKSGVEIGAHDSKQLLILFGQRELPLPTPTFDSQLIGYLLDASESHDLERLAATEFGLTLAPLESLLPRQGRTKLQLDEIPVETAATAAAARASAIWRLWEPLLNRLEEDTLTKTWQETDLPLCKLLAELEQLGVLVDTAALKGLGATVATELRGLEAKAHQIAGKDFNVNSPKQLEKLLFDDFGLKPIKRTKTSRSTDAETLEALSEDHELPAVILEIRQLAKLQGTYIETLPQLIHPKTKRLHTQWRQDVAATGRLSSSDPNLQNIPIRTELGRQIRAAFIAPPGCKLVSADYSQIELRVLAHLSGDPTLIDAFESGQDIHQRTAMEIFEVDASEVDSDLRRKAKAVNFGVIYGQGDSALAKSLGISRMEASQFIAAYFRRYEGVRKFTAETLASARTSGGVRTLFGRRRLIADLNHANRARRLAAERIAMNTPIQGTAADLLKMAMLQFVTPITPGARMILTVHDELVFEVPDAEVDAAKTKIRDAMQSVYQLRVPLVVDVGSGPNWSAAH